MREILFRGKANSEIREGEWVYGSLLAETTNTFPIIARDYDNDEDWLGVDLWDTVEPHTVGQYTGLTDKKGKKIFEGDIVRGRHWTSHNNKNIEEWHSWCVDWSEKSGLITFVDSPTTECKLSIHDFADFEEVEVVGNIYDNPELLEVNNDER